MNRPTESSSNELDFGSSALDFTADLPPAVPYETAVRAASFGDYSNATSAPQTKGHWWHFQFDWHWLMPSCDWLISFIVHASLLIALACITISVQEMPSLSLIESSTDGDSAGDLQAAVSDELSEFAMASLVMTDLDVVGDVPNLERLDPSATLDAGAGMLMSSAAAEQTLAAMSSASMTAGRTGRSKSALLSKYGGTEKTEAAVRNGLVWLVKQQQPDGSWSFAGPYRDGSRFTENSVAATGMALLALLGAGHTHQSGLYEAEVQKALRWLTQRQNSDGNWGLNTPVHHAIYTHAIATLAVSEAYAMTNDSWLRQYVEQGLKYTLRAQGSAGGWRYEYRGESDTSVTGWCVMAIVSARSAGLAVPEAGVRRIHAFLNSVDTDNHSLYGYTRSRNPTGSMTAEGILCRMYLGWPRSSPAIDVATAWLLEYHPFKERELRYYYWYYATQVMHHAGGNAWKEWNTAMREGLPKLQVVEGEEAGSWPPAPSGTDSQAGRLYATCIALYCLEVYYRHMPLYTN